MVRVWTPSPEDLDRINRRARRDGMFAGLTGGLFAAIYGERALRFDRRKALASGLLAGALSGYFFSQAFLKTHLGRLEHENLRKAQLDDKNDPDNFQMEESSVLE